MEPSGKDTCENPHNNDQPSTTAGTYTFFDMNFSFISFVCHSLHCVLVVFFILLFICYIKFL